MICDATAQETPLHQMMAVRHSFNDYRARPRISSAVVESLSVTECETREAGGVPPASAKRIISQKHASPPIAHLFDRRLFATLSKVYTRARLRLSLRFRPSDESTSIWCDNHHPDTAFLRAHHIAPWSECDQMLSDVVRAELRWQAGILLTDKHRTRLVWTAPIFSRVYRPEVTSSALILAEHEIDVSHEIVRC